ncbi:MAG: hypothetical protein GY809_05515, partial [Planctomycetes bacterium]|nr:hypothetical protein [Planctomycetota bacterium]
SFQAPRDPEAEKAFGYDIWLSKTDDGLAPMAVERWRIPRPAMPGTHQRVLIENLDPGESYFCFVQPYDAAGNGSHATRVHCQLPARRSEPTLVESAFHVPALDKTSVRGVPGVLRYWVSPETTKVNPMTGNRMEDGFSETGSNDYKTANAIWNAASHEISLNASKNEMIGFQVILERVEDRL